MLSKMCLIYSVLKPILFLRLSVNITNQWHKYLVGHQSNIGDIQALINNIKGITLAGNAYTGIGIPDCIHSSEQAALSLLNSI